MPRLVVPILLPGEPFFLRLVQLDVIRHDQMRAAADFDVFRIYAAGFQLIDLAGKTNGSTTTPGPMMASASLMQNARSGTGAEPFFAFDDHGVIGIVAAWKRTTMSILSPKTSTIFLFLHHPIGIRRRHIQP